MRVRKSIKRRVKVNRHGVETGSVYRARYYDDNGDEHCRHFDMRKEATAWIDQQTAGLVTGTHITPTDAGTTMQQWSETWLQGYSRNRASSYRQAKSHLRHINTEFGSMRLSEIRPSQIKSWTSRLHSDQGLADSTIYAIYRRLSHVLSDAVDDGILIRNPCNRKTAPKRGSHEVTLPTTDQVWTIYEAFPAHLRVGVLLGAFAGLRISEVCGLRVTDIDFLGRQINPAVQHGGVALKTETSRDPVPIPSSLTEFLSVHVRDYASTTVLADMFEGTPVGPWTLEKHWRAHRPVPSMRFHDLRHYYASLLIVSGADVKTVQANLRHATAKTTLDTYGHLWPDYGERARGAVESVFEQRRNAV